MCGILGIINFKNNISLEGANKALQTLKHRGPDFQNHWFDGSNIYLGHTRLSIIDLSENANQPLASNRYDVKIIFNGEIYNFKELRASLKFKNFKTESDTEVILEGYIEEGVEFFSRLRGIYAFAILDLRSDPTLVVARDPGGIKPLYYISENNSFKFASEIKALKATGNNHSELNQNAIQQYINLGYIPEPNTAYKNISALQPGHYLIIKKDVLPIEHYFLKYDFDETNDFNFNKNVETVSALLEQASSRNLIADVNVSIALSGGIDSSLLYFYSMKHNKSLKAITVSFNRDNNYDESADSISISKKLNGDHELIHLNENINMEMIHDIFDHFDQPYADTSAIPFYLLTRQASKFSKVLIGGDGGDELFNGYPSQTLLSRFNKYNQFGFLFKLATHFKSFYPDEVARKLDRMSGLTGAGDDPFQILYNRNSWFPSTVKFNGESVFNYNVTGPVKNYGSLIYDEIPGDFDHKIVFDYFRKTMLSDYLRKTDMMSMIHGVEYRVPMLDEDLVNFALTIPFNQKSNHKETKIILRKLHYKIFQSGVSQAPKSGFSIPLDTYLTIENKKHIASVIQQKDGIVSEFINNNYVQFLIDEFINYKSKRQISRSAVYQRIMILYNLQRWHSNK